MNFGCNCTLKIGGNSVTIVLLEISNVMTIVLNMRRMIMMMTKLRMMPIPRKANPSEEEGDARTLSSATLIVKPRQ